MTVKNLVNLHYSWCETKRSPLYKTVKLKEYGFFRTTNNMTRIMGVYAEIMASIKNALE